MCGREEAVYFPRLEKWAKSVQLIISPRHGQTKKSRERESEKEMHYFYIDYNEEFDANTSHFLVNFAPIEHYQRGEVKIYVFVPKGNKLKIEAQFQGVDLIEVIETTDCG
jgi:hypothetical protein